MAYDDGYNAALTDAQTAEDERMAALAQEHQDALARARAEGIASARADAKVTPIKQNTQAAKNAAQPKAEQSKPTEDKAPLYDDLAKSLNRP